MSTTDAGRFSAEAPRSTAAPLDLGIRTLLMPLASLKLTVVLFALSLILVLAGTLAQIDHDIWYVVHNYFRVSFAWIDFQVFLPRAWEVPGGFWFPGGWILGAALGVNLVAAHALRFKIAAQGQKLWIGLGILAAGIGLTWLVIQSGLDDTVESELSPEFCNGLWHALRFALGAGTLGLAYLLSLSYGNRKAAGTLWLWWLGAVTCILLFALSVWLYTNPAAKLDPSGLRIMWQLIKSTGAGIVLLVGCYQVFGHRGGIVLLHGGIALMMFSELWTALHAQESQMRIVEGQTKSYAEDIRTTELAFIDKSSAKQDVVTVVPLPLLEQAFKTGELLDDPQLPFAIQVRNYMQNARTRSIQPGEENLASHGIGLLKTGEEFPINTGVGDQSIDMAAMYVELFTKKEQESLGTYFLSVVHPSQPIEGAQQAFDVALRFEQVQKPYSVKLLDFTHDTYSGTSKAKNYMSVVQLTEPDKNVDREFKIWMNNPLRYGGDTLYQSGFDPNNENLTILQVTTNSGWMIPYVSCMIVLIGMLAQFGTTFWKFARKERAPARSNGRESLAQLASNWTSPAVWVPALVLLFCGTMILGKARTPSPSPGEMQIHEFGKLPVAYNGRVKPFDTLARNTLNLLSDKTTLEVEDPKRAGKTIKKPAIYWMLEFLADTPESHDLRVFRVENLDVLQILGLERRKGFRYSLAEVIDKKFEIATVSGQKQLIPEALRQAQMASEVPKEERDLTQAKFIELGQKLNVFGRIREAFSSPRIRMDSLDAVKKDLQMVDSQIASLNLGSPRAVPPLEPTKPWLTMLEAEREGFLQRVGKKEPDPAAIELRKMLNAYADDEVQAFNTAVADYREILSKRQEADVAYVAELVEAGEGDGRKTAERLSLDRVAFESFFNHFNPFTNAMVLYIGAFLLAGFSWLGWNTLLNRSANWVLWLTFALHTYALVCRVYISGRPPVTNLYSSAVFIGWAAVLFALVFEMIYRFGIGNLLAAMIGFPTLYIAYGLAGDGDTFEVLQAVLDTQFWLATHVVCITLGYSATFLAGFLGIAYVLMGQIGKMFDTEQRKQLVRMTYGMICFATFFSFVGTVLGGLWADDSWGRFWGWDPKENGALMIVIWNALVLHARWGGMTRERGLAVLSIFGNVITAWSWFGVNQMGVGLHSYGTTEGRTQALFLFAISQLVIMALAFMPFSRDSAKNDGELAASNA